MPLMSMTGFGRWQVSQDQLQLTIEVKSVNHRYLDAAWKLPPAYSAFEIELGKILKAKLKRGRVDIYISRREVVPSGSELAFNEELFKRYFEISKKVLDETQLSDRQTLADAALSILQKREVLEIVPRDADAKQEFDLLQTGLSAALDSLNAMRETEGEALERDIHGNLALVEELVGRITGRSDITPEEFKSRLQSRLQRLSPDLEVDPNRLAQEAALLAERTDISEELSRLASHVAQFRAICREPGCGRKLDFLLQEMGREINTVGSKAQNSDVSAAVVEVKTFLERIREQVQNVE